MRKKLQFILALLLVAATGAWAQSDWTDIVVNGDMEGTDVSCFYLAEHGIGGPYIARIKDGIGKDGSRAIAMYSSGNESNSWETQFFIRLPYELPVGTQYRLSFDYKADKTCEFDMQIHNEPSQYVHWTLDGWPAPGGTFSLNWKTFYGQFTVPGDCDGSDGGGFSKIFQTIAIDVATNQAATVYVFDNIKFEIPTSVLNTLTSSPATDMVEYPMTGVLGNLIKDAQALVDEDAVAVGKLLAAIETAQAVTNPTDADVAALQAAIDQFKADNITEIVDLTNLVGTAQTDWQGATAVYNDRTVVTATGAEEVLNERFGDTSVGNKLWQELTGLENGLYTIELFATSHNAWEGEWMNVTDASPAPTLQEDATDVAYIFGTSGENTLKTWITARRNSDMLGSEPEAYTVKDLKVENGSLTMGLALDIKGKTEWHTIQISSLKKVTYISRDEYAEQKAEMEDAMAAANDLKAEYGSDALGLEAINDALEAAEAAMASNMLNVSEFEAEVAKLKAAVEAFSESNFPYDVTFAEDLADVEKWSANPNPVAATKTVTLNYSGKKKVKNIIVTKKEAALTGTIYSWESSSTGVVTETGGTIEYKNGDGNRVNFLHNETGKYTICLNGKKNNITEETASANAGRMDVTLDNALAAGDVISITGYIYKNESKESTAYFIFNGANGFDINNMSVYAESDAFGNGENLYPDFNGSPKTVTVTVPAEAAGCKSFTMTRGKTGTNLFITKLEITRGETK